MTIRFVKFVDPNTIVEIMGRRDSLLLTRKYIMSRFGSANMQDGYKYMDTLLAEADGLFASVRDKDSGELEVLSIAIYDSRYVTFFSSGAHPTITYRFMKFIVEQMHTVLVYTTVGIMEKLLIKLGFRLINFEYGGRWYSYLPNTEGLIPEINKRPDGTVH